MPMVVLPWRDAPDWAFREWLRRTFRHARSPMFRMPEQWGALMRFAASRRQHVVDLGADDLRLFFTTWTHESGGSKYAARCRRLLEVLSLVFDDMRRSGFRDQNPAQALLGEYPAVSRPLPVVLTPVQRASLEQLLNGHGGGWQIVRNRALALLVLVDGMRPAKIAALTLADVDTTDGAAPRIRLTAPGGHAVRAWIERRRALGIRGDCLFPANEQGVPFTPLALYRLVRRMLRRSGIDVHSLSRLDIRDCLASCRQFGVKKHAISTSPSQLPVPRMPQQKEPSLLHH
jgi:integrase